MQIQFPMSDFGQVYAKEYEIHGAKFTVEVLNVGPNDLGPTWLFRLLVKGNVIEGGPHTPQADHTLTDENVANRLASFWGHSQIVQDAQNLAGTDEYELEQLAFKCADWMHEYFMQDDSFRDFEIISTYMDENGWDIYLSPNYLPDRIVRFTIADDKKMAKIACYTRDRELNAFI